MIKYVIKRILIMIPVLLGVMFIIFTINALTPGDPVAMLLGSNYTQEQYDAKVEELGLDQPFVVRYVNYIKDIVTKFDFGESYADGRPVGDKIMQRLGVTLALGFVSCLVTAIAGLIIGIISAVKQYSALDYIISSLASIFAAIPNFWLAAMGILIFSITLGILPASGLSTWKHWILPVLCNSLGPVALILRTTRSSMLDVIRQDYIRTARAKGVDEKSVILKHALKNAVIPVITVIGMQMSIVIGGSVIVETLFNIKGLGSLLVTAINGRDYPTIQGIVLVLAVAVCVINLIVDLAYAAVDPRIRAQYTEGGKRKKKSKKEATA